MDLYIPIHDSSELFNSKPMEKKGQKAETQRIIRKNLSLAFSQCISSYMMSEVQNPEEMSFAKPKVKTEREAVKIRHNLSQDRRQKLKKIFEAKKNQINNKIKELTVYVTQKLCQIAQSVTNMSDIYQTQDERDSKKCLKLIEVKTQLNESNKNFLVELFSEAKLLKSYKGMDRTFPRLVEQAQKTYFEVKSFIKSESLSLKKKSNKQKQKHFAQLKKDQKENYETVNSIFSMKRRHKEAVGRFEQQFETNRDTSRTIGYESSQTSGQNQILEFEYYSDFKFLYIILMKYSNDEQIFLHQIIAHINFHHNKNPNKNKATFQSQQTMQPSTAPNPQRFEVFTELSNGKGFRIKSSKYIYFFDKYGGWYDEYNNYFNADGEHEDPPHDEDEDFQKVVLEDEYLEGGEDDDYYDRLYGGNVAQEDYEDDEENHSTNNESQKTLEAIAKNIAILHEYPIKTPLRVDFFNMTFKTSKQEILKHYRSKLGNSLLNVILTQDHGKFTGEGYFVCQDVSAAQKLIKYEGEEFLGRKVFFDVEPLEENFADPVRNDEMDVAFNEDEFESLVKEKPAEEKDQQINPKKKYFAKNQNTEKFQKEEQKPLQQQKTESSTKQVKTQTKTTEVKLQSPQKEEKKEKTWAKYHAEMTMFPKKESFKDWMQTFGFKQNEHFKNLTKVESKDQTKRFATVQLRSDAHEKIHGKEYNNKKVQFEKVN